MLFTNLLNFLLSFLKIFSQKNFNQSEFQKSHYKNFFLFKKEFQKQYPTLIEHEYRFYVYIKNYEKIEQHNKKNSSYKLSVNKFADLSWQEFQNSYLTFTIKNENFNQKGENFTNVDSIDWRDLNVITSVKEQKFCESSWALSSVGAIESFLAIRTKNLIELSSQELIDCSFAYHNNGCSGGLITNSYDYIIENKIGLENDYPYIDNDSYNCIKKLDKKRYAINAYKALSHSHQSVQNLSQMLKQNPVAVFMEVQHDFQFYKSGIYSVKKDCGYRLNHSVLLVGQKNNYYIVKNNWGEKWGMSGYAYIEIGSGQGNCGIANYWDAIPVD